MLSLFLLLVFVGVTAGLWFQGTWNNALALINLTLATLVATNYYEPICGLIEGFDKSFTYLLDFVVIWILFALFYGIFRAVTDTLSGSRVKFVMPAEMALRSVLAIWCGWLMTCFVAFTMQFAPLNAENPLGGWENEEGVALFVGPERLWWNFMQNRSMNALSRGKFSAKPPHPQAQADGRNVEAFDPTDTFFLKYHTRRKKYSETESMRVN